MDQTTIGKLLLQKREQKKVSLKEVAEKTKININILRSLEADDLENLPNKTYVRGFVQNYAKTIGLDIDEATQVLQDTYQAQNPEDITPIENEELSVSDAPAIELSAKQLELREKFVGFVHKLIEKKTLISIAIIVLIVFITKGVIGFFTKVSNEQVKIRPETSNAATIKSADESLFDIKATKKLNSQTAKTTDVTTQDENNNQKSGSTEAAVPLNNVAETSQVKLDSNENAQSEEKPEKKSDSETEPELENGKLPFKQFFPAPLNMYEVAASAPENVNEDFIPTSVRESVLADQENVFVNATEGDTWISYQTDDSDIKRYVLKKGRHLIIRGKVILLFLGNANMTKIFYNNQLVTFETRTGVKSLIFPPAQIKNYELPLFPSFKGVPYKQSVYKQKMAAPKE